MERPHEKPIRLSGGTGPEWPPPSYPSERERVDQELAAERLRVAELELERARLALREARERANREIGVIRGHTLG